MNSDVFLDASNDVSILTNSCTSLRTTSRHYTPIQSCQINLGLNSAKIQEPLFLRKCRISKAQIGCAPPEICPLMNGELWTCNRKHHAQSILLAGLDSPTFCVRYLAINTRHIGRKILICQSPMNNIIFVARPAIQPVIQTQITDSSETVKLMLSPERANIAQKLIPNWRTVTFTLAFGKHIAVKFRVFDVKKQEVQYVKAVRERGKRVPTSTLHRVEPIQKIEFWRSAKPHSLILSTVEQCDPELVKRVFIDHTGAPQVHDL
ncbi:unnamed protein product [Caenorhabditis bovis]|uniref:Uncharacterized protein n=1 Tax=Caenorhabditis bovis TaxID=2654633 RepID=A0A8S1EM23_9PELO|nr:unnamed protein product [Caenorhabditis bovis]